MEKEFVPYEEALALKELGFDESCLATIDQIDFIHIKGTKSSPRGSMMYDTINCPTFSQAFAFFREKYGYDVTIKKCTPSEFKFEIEQLFAKGNNHYFIDFPFKSHKEAELKCIDKLIETVKRKV